jgi:integrase
MASVYKPSGRNIYRIEFADQHGIKRTVSSGLRDGRLAESLALRIENDVARLRAGLEPAFEKQTGPFLGLSLTGRPWKEFREEFRKRVLVDKAPDTRLVYENVLNTFERIAKPRVVADITTDDIERYIDERRAACGRNGEPLRAGTLNKDLRHLRAALKQAADWKYLSRAPAVRMLPEMTHEKRYVLPEHFARLYEAAAKATKPTPIEGATAAGWWQAFLITLYLTGWRVGQTLSLRRDAVEVLPDGTGIARFGAEQTKGKRAEAVPLHALVIDHLGRIGGGSELYFPWPHHRRTLDLVHSEIQTAAEIDLPCRRSHAHSVACRQYSFHDYRRAFATLNHELDPAVLQRMMQHKTFATTKGYIALGERLKPTLPRLFVPDQPLPTAKGKEDVG